MGSTDRKVKKRKSRKVNKTGNGANSSTSENGVNTQTTKPVTDLPSVTVELQNDVQQKELAEMQKMMDAEDLVLEATIPSLSRGSNPYVGGNQCLFCRCERTSSKEDKDEESGDGDKCDTTSVSLPLWVCADCRKTVEEDEEEKKPQGSSMSMLFDSDLETLDMFGPNVETFMGVGTRCRCQACEERRQIEVEHENETLALQQCWLELNKVVRSIYREGLNKLANNKTEDSDSPEYDENTVKNWVHRLCGRDPHQLFERLENQEREFVTEMKLLLIKQMNTEGGGHKNAKEAKETMMLLLEEHKVLCQTARKLAGLLHELEKVHLKNFSLTWEFLSKHMFHSVIYSDPKIQDTLPKVMNVLRAWASSKESISEDTSFLSHYHKLDNEMSVISVVWRDCHQLIEKYKDEQSALKAKQKMFREDWEFFKAQRKMLAETMQSTGTNTNHNIEAELFGAIRQAFEGTKPAAQECHCTTCNRTRCGCHECSIRHAVTCGILDPDIASQVPFPFNHNPDYVIDVQPPSMSSTSSSSGSESPIMMPPDRLTLPSDDNFDLDTEEIPEELESGSKDDSDDESTTGYDEEGTGEYDEEEGQYDDEGEEDGYEEDCEDDDADEEPQPDTQQVEDIAAVSSSANLFNLTSQAQGSASSEQCGCSHCVQAQREQEIQQQAAASQCQCHSCLQQNNIPFPSSSQVTTSSSFTLYPHIHGANTPLHGANTPLHGTNTPLHGAHTPLHGANTALHGVAPGQQQGIHPTYSTHNIPPHYELHAMQQKVAQQAHVTQSSAPHNTQSNPFSLEEDVYPAYTNEWDSTFEPGKPLFAPRFGSNFDSELFNQAPPPLLTPFNPDFGGTALADMIKTSSVLQHCGSEASSMTQQNTTTSSLLNSTATPINNDNLLYKFLEAQQKQNKMNNALGVQNPGHGGSLASKVRPFAPTSASFSALLPPVSMSAFSQAATGQTPHFGLAVPPPLTSSTDPSCLNPRLEHLQHTSYSHVTTTSSPAVPSLHHLQFNSDFIRSAALNTKDHLSSVAASTATQQNGGGSHTPHTQPAVPPPIFQNMQNMPNINTLLNIQQPPPPPPATAHTVLHAAPPRASCGNHTSVIPSSLDLASFTAASSPSDNIQATAPQPKDPPPPRPNPKPKKVAVRPSGNQPCREAIAAHAAAAAAQTAAAGGGGQTAAAVPAAPQQKQPQPQQSPQQPNNDEYSDTEGSDSEKSCSTTMSNPAKEGKYCDCFHCELYGHSAPPSLPTSKNYPEMRDKLRHKLEMKKSETKCKNAPVDRKQHCIAAKLQASTAKPVPVPAVAPPVTTTPATPTAANTVQPKLGKDNIDEIVKFITGEADKKNIAKDEDEEEGKKSAKAAKRARQKQRKVEEKARKEAEEQARLAEQHKLEQQAKAQAEAQKLIINSQKKKKSKAKTEKESPQTSRASSAEEVKKKEMRKSENSQSRGGTQSPVVKKKQPEPCPKPLTTKSSDKSDSNSRNKLSNKDVIENSKNNKSKTESEKSRVKSKESVKNHSVVNSKVEPPKVPERNQPAQFNISKKLTALTDQIRLQQAHKQLQQRAQQHLAQEKQALQPMKSQLQQHMQKQAQKHDVKLHQQKQAQNDVKLHQQKQAQNDVKLHTKQAQNDVKLHQKEAQNDVKIHQKPAPHHDIKILHQQKHPDMTPRPQITKTQLNLSPGPPGKPLPFQPPPSSRDNTVFLNGTRDAKNKRPASAKQLVMNSNHQKQPVNAATNPQSKQGVNNFVFAATHLQNQSNPLVKNGQNQSNSVVKNSQNQPNSVVKNTQIQPNTATRNAQNQSNPQARNSPQKSSNNNNGVKATPCSTPVINDTPTPLRAQENIGDVGKGNTGEVGKGNGGKQSPKGKEEKSPRGNEQNSRSKKSKRKNKGGDDITSLDEIFLPKDDGDHGDMDDFEREIEEFKRFCMDSTPVEKREKIQVQVNLKDIFSKKKSGLGCA